MTGRERILLGTALAMYIGYLGWNMILSPALKERETARQKLWNLEEEERKRRAGQLEEDEKFQISLLKEARPEEVDRLVQELAAEAGMEVVSFQSGEAQEAGEESALRKLPVEIELEGPDFECAVDVAEGIHEMEEAVLIDRMEAQPETEGVYLKMELGLYYMDGEM